MEIPRLDLPEEARPLGASIIKQYSVYETFPAHCHTFAEFFFIGQGRAMHGINGRHQLLVPGSLVYIRPDDVHFFSPLNHFDFVLYSIGFSCDEARRAAAYLGAPLPGGPLPPHVILCGSERGFLEQRLEDMLAASPADRLSILRSLLPQVLLAVGAPSDAQRDPVMPPWLAALDEAMRRRENYVAGLPRMLELCRYSQAYLNRMFRLHMKITPTEYINALRMDYATELLMVGGRSVTEICFLTGFNNLSHFYSVFRGLYGCAPREFLRRLS